MYREDEIVDIKIQNMKLNYEFNEAKNGLVVTGGEFEGEVIIPSQVTIKGVSYPVTEIGKHAFSCLYRSVILTKIDFPDSIKSIGEHAFQDCCFKKVVLPSSLKRIEPYAFNGCSLLHTIVISGPATSVDECAEGSTQTIDYPAETIFKKNAFNGCDNLSDIVFNGNYEQWKQITFEDYFSSYRVERLFIDGELMPDNGKWTYRNGNEWNCWIDEYGVVYSEDRKVLLKAPKTIKEYTIPDGTNHILYDAFNGCKELISIHMPNSIYTMGSEAFLECERLERVVLSKCLTEIPYHAFESCKMLKDISIPPYVTIIGSSAFENCESLQEIVIPESVEKIEAYAFWNCKNLHATIMGIKKYIGKHAFRIYNDESKVEIIVNGEKIQKGSINSSRGRYEGVVYVGDVYDGKANGFGKRILETPNGSDIIDEGYYYDGLFVTGPGFDEQGRRHGNGYFHGLTDEEFERIWDDNS